MKIIKQICIILGICWISLAIEHFLPFSFSASIIGMLIVLIMLLTGFLKTSQIQEISDFLLSNMAFLFVPAGVSIINYFDILRENAWQILLICMVSTVVVFGTTSIAMRLTMKAMNKLSRRGKDEC